MSSSAPRRRPPAKRPAVVDESRHAPSMGTLTVGCSQNPLTTVHGTVVGEHPQVKRGSTHSRSGAPFRPPASDSGPLGENQLLKVRDGPTPNAGSAQGTRWLALSNSDPAGSDQARSHAGPLRRA